MKFKIQSTLAFIVALSLVACGGGKEEAVNKFIEGTLVVPSTSKTKKLSLKRIKERAAGTARKKCANVPDGYEPLKNANVNFLDSSKAVVKATTTDVCGKFSVETSDDIVTVKATSVGNKDLITDIKVFKTVDSLLAVASTIPTNAKYQISSIQITDSNSVAFSVTDTITNHAVIGMPQSALTTKINGSNSSVTDFSNAANVVDPASITLVMDASGSMNKNNVKDNKGNDLVDPSDSSNYTRLRMASIAAHTYLTNMPKADETAITIFDQDVNFIDDAEIKRLVNYISSAPNASQKTVEYKFSESGFTKEASKLRLIIDTYNLETEVVTSFGNYGTPAGPIRKHHDTPDLKAFSSVYPWGGATAAYDAIQESLVKTYARSNSRKIVIAMTDGQDNRSAYNENSVIASANAKSIPVYTIGFGNSTSANNSLKKIAEKTNASFLKVTGIDLISAFRSIQTAITFQYLANIEDNIQAGDIVEVSLHFDGTVIKRSITR
jgi:uncharacterized protein YegL